MTLEYAGEGEAFMVIADVAVPPGFTVDTTGFDGLVEEGFSIRQVHEAPRYLLHDTEAPPGSYEHMLTYVQQLFAIVARKE